MKDSLRPGVSRTNRIEIDRDRTIGFMGEEGRVYATPRLVHDIEHTCRDLLLEHARRRRGFGRHRRVDQAILPRRCPA